MAQSATLLTTGAPAPGTQLPDFTLKLAKTDGITDFKLSDHLGKGPLVFAFFPAAFTGVCTKEVCELRDTLQSFASLGAQVYGFSTDPAPSNKAFALQEHLTFGILSDPNRTFVGHVWPANTRPIYGNEVTAKRGAMVVSPDGTVKWASASDDVTAWIGADEVRKHL
jgi:peroxiredoxin